MHLNLNPASNAITFPHISLLSMTVPTVGTHSVALAVSRRKEPFLEQLVCVSMCVLAFAFSGLFKILSRNDRAIL